MPLYTAFGLQIDSELRLPWLLPGSGRPSDVKIRLGSVPTTLPDPLVKGSHFEATLDTFLFRVKDVARYLVVKGEQIIIDRAPDGPEDLLDVFLMGSCFGALMHQRRLLVMHASSIQTAHGAVLFVGPSGHGKSTLLAALVDRGYAMLADDVTAIEVESQSVPVAFASFPRMRLGVEAATRVGISVDSLPRATDTGKCLVPVENFCTQALPVHAIYALSVHEATNIKVAPVDTLHRFAIVGTNTYRYSFLEGLGLRQVHFHAAARLAKAVQICRITRPAAPFMLDELVARLEEEFGAPPGTAKEKEVS
jgi:hypothetical protein